MTILQDIPGVNTQHSIRFATSIFPILVLYKIDYLLFLGDCVIQDIYFQDHEWEGDLSKLQQDLFVFMRKMTN